MYFIYLILIFTLKLPCVDRFLWQIPLTYVTSSSSTVHRFLLNKKTGECAAQIEEAHVYILKY